MTPFDSALAVLRKERDMISKAPWSFVSVCVISLGFIWVGFSWLYKGKLADLSQDRDHWKSNSEYWEDQSKHPAMQPSPLNIKMPSPAEQEAALAEESRLKGIYEKEHAGGSLNQVAEIDWVNSQLEAEGSPLRLYVSHRPEPCPNGYAEIGTLETDHVQNSVVVNNPCFKLDRGKFTNGKNGIISGEDPTPPKPQ